MPQKLREKITAGRLLAMIRAASSREEFLSLLRQIQETRFHEALYEVMQAKGLDAREMIRRTGIERAYFYHILNGSQHPGRNMVLRIGLCLSVSLQKMNRLLRLAGVPELYPRRRRDAVLIYAVTHRYDMEQTNAVLAESGETPLYTAEK